MLFDAIKCMKKTYKYKILE